MFVLLSKGQTADTRRTMNDLPPITDNQRTQALMALDNRVMGAFTRAINAGLELDDELIDFIRCLYLDGYHDAYKESAVHKGQLVREMGFAVLPTHESSGELAARDEHTPEPGSFRWNFAFSRSKLIKETL